MHFLNYLPNHILHPDFSLFLLFFYLLHFLFLLLVFPHIALFLFLYCLICCLEIFHIHPLWPDLASFFPISSFLHMSFHTILLSLMRFLNYFLAHILHLDFLLFLLFFYLLRFLFFLLVFLHIALFLFLYYLVFFLAFFHIHLSKSDLVNFFPISSFLHMCFHTILLSLMHFLNYLLDHILHLNFLLFLLFLYLLRFLFLLLAFLHISLFLLLLLLVFVLEISHTHLLIVYLVNFFPISSFLHMCFHTTLLSLTHFLNYLLDHILHLNF